MKQPKSLFEGFIDASSSLVEQASKTIRGKNSVGHSVGHSVEYSTAQPAEQLTQIPSHEPSQIPTEQPTQIPSHEPSQIPTEQLTQIPSQQPILVQNEAILFHCLKQLNGQVTTMAKIHQATDISIDTLRGCLKRLRQKGMISQNGGLKNVAGQIGFSRKTTETKFVLRGNSENLKSKLASIDYRSLPIVTNQLDDQLNDQLLSSSSFIYNKTTTTKRIEYSLNVEPELGYWRDKGLTAKQLQGWLKTAQCPLGNMIQYLCYCRFELVDMNIEKSKPVKNAFNWFFRILEKTGGYPKPKGYKSFEQKQLETEHAIISEREKQAKEAKYLYQRKIVAEQDKGFWEMMNSPESELYRRCFDSLNSFERKLKSTGKPFEAAMRRAFEETE
ncbi:MAG: PT domain-containing protein [Deltaproteobacteria bacterium]|jgi:hypothetical protein|nr:PT domain-containing protein [Deltaproteobacteria bacterium]